MSLQRGRRLGQYEIVEPIGAGGMGEVYRARDLRLERDVAIKVLPLPVADDVSRRARFEREAKAIAALNHENIVTIHTIDDEAGVHYLAMELVQGETLSDRVPHDGLSADRLLDLAVPIVSALAAAHARGIVHRDLKPTNVMVTDDGKVKVLDFGLAKLAHVDDEPAADTIEETMTADGGLHTREGAIVGTVPYMSPEQLSGRSVGPASDLFSVGVILYEMATGTRPFTGNSSTELISSILTSTPPPVRELKPALPDELGSLISQCLAKEPGERPSSAEQLRRELETLRRDRAQPHAASATQADRRIGHRVGSVALVTLVLVVAAVLGWRALGPEPGAGRGGMLRLGVVPFAADEREQSSYLARGLSDEIARRLAGLRALDIRTVGDLAPGTAAADAGRHLEVDYVLTGSVSSDGTTVTIEPRLLRVADGAALWRESYDASDEQLLELQDRISSRVVHELGLTLSDRERDRLKLRTTDDTLAYETYLRGVEAQPHSHDSEAEYRRALRLFEQAVAVDPDFALAWVSLAHNHLQLYWLGYDRTQRRLDQAVEALDRAEAIAPDLADVHLQRGYLHYHGSLDFDKALRELSIAARDIPNDPELIRTIAYIWRRQGLFEQAIENLERARELSPFEPYQSVELAYTRLFVDDYDQVFDEIEQARSRDPAYDWAYMLAAYAYWHRGRAGDLERARVELAKHPDPRDDYPAWFRILQHWYERDFDAAHDRIANLAEPCIKLQSQIAPRDMLAGMTYLMQGDREAARPRFVQALEQLEQLEQELPRDHRVLAALGLTHAALGNKQQAIRYGEQAVEIYPVEQDMLMGPDRLWDLARIYIIVGDEDAALDQIAYLLSLRTHFSAAMLELDPVLDPLRDHPRFATLMR